MDVPEDIRDEAAKLATDVNDWLKAGNSVGHLSEHAVAGLADTFERALLAERLAQKERDAKIAYEAALYSGCPADFIAEEIAEAVRNQAPGGIAYRTQGEDA